MSGTHHNHTHQSLSENTPLLAARAIRANFFQRRLFALMPRIFRNFGLQEPQVHVYPLRRRKNPDALSSPQKRNFITLEGQDVENFLPGNDKIKVDTSLPPKERFDQIVVKQTFDNGRPLHDEEFLIPLLAAFVVLGACSPSKDFADRFIEGIQKVLGLTPTPEEVAEAKNSCSEYVVDGVEVVVGLANFFTQASLTAKSFIHVFCRLWRIQSLPDHEYIQELTLTEKLVLAGVTLTGFSSAKMVFDSMSKKYHLNPILSYTLAALSYTSSVFVNENFTYDRLLSMHGNRYDLAILRLLTKTKLEIRDLANDSENPDAFIERLSTGTWFRQLIRHNTLHNIPEQNENTIWQLIELTETTAGSHLFDDPEDWAWLNTDNVLSLMLGLLASAMNTKAGLQVPNFISAGYLPEINVNEFFSHLLEQTWDVYTTFAIGMLFFGLTSGGVNTIINSRSCHELILTIKAFLPALMSSGFSSISKTERMILGTIFFLATGYAIGKAGAMLKYALIEVVPIPLLMAIMTLPVFLGLGVMSMRGAWAAGRNAKDWDLLDEALKAPSLSCFYDELDYEDQMVLRRLLLTKFTLAIDGMYACYNQTKPYVTGSHLFSQELLRALEEKFGVNAGVIDIQVENDVITGEEQDMLHSPTTSPRLLLTPAHTPLPSHANSPHTLFAIAKQQSDDRLGFSQPLLDPGRSPRIIDTSFEEPDSTENSPIRPLVLTRQTSHSHTDLSTLDKSSKRTHATYTPTLGKSRYGSG